MKPKKQDYFTTVFAAVFGYIFVILLALHSGQSYIEDKNIFKTIASGFVSLLSDPTNINTNSGTLPCLLIYTGILRRL